MRLGAISISAMAGFAGAAAFSALPKTWPTWISASTTEAQATIITGMIGAFIALIAAIAAIWGVASQRGLVRKQLTFQHLAQSESDGSFQKALQIFSHESNEPAGLVKWADKRLEGTEQQKAIVSILNWFELSSLGIQMGIIDGALFQKLNAGHTIFCWTKAQAFVAALRARTGRKAIYHEFEELARWLEQDTLPKRRFWWVGLR